MSENRSSLPPLVLVTGATGYVALHIVRCLLQNNYRIRGTVRSEKNVTKLQALRDLFPANPRFPLQIVEATLEKDDGWSEAVFECDYVIHVAGLSPKSPGITEKELEATSLAGTLRLLKACSIEARNKKLKRVVLTGSILAVHGQTDVDESRIYNEDDWTDPLSPTTSLFAKYKTIVEKKSWEFVNNLISDEKFELTVINGSMALGPLLSNGHSASHEILCSVMDRKRCPMLPEIRICLCDVRDFAEAHVKAMTVPEAAGKRHVFVQANLWAKEIAQILHDEFGPLGYSIAQTYAPLSFFWVTRVVNKSVQSLIDILGKSYYFDSSKTKESLNIGDRDMRSTLIDTTHSLIQKGIIKKTKAYKKPELSDKTAFLF